MRSFEVHLNGQKLCIAGVKGDESLSVIVSHTPDHEFLYVGGSTGPQGDHAQWIDMRQLSLGDVITVKAVESEDVDEPISVERPSCTLPLNWPPPDVMKRRVDGSPVCVACPVCKSQFSTEDSNGSWKQLEQTLYDLYSEHFRLDHAERNKK